jgi:hypothetical protein
VRERDWNLAQGYGGLPVRPAFTLPCGSRQPLLRPACSALRASALADALARSAWAGLGWAGLGWAQFGVQRRGEC